MPNVVETKNETIKTNQYENFILGNSPPSGAAIIKEQIKEYTAPTNRNAVVLVGAYRTNRLLITGVHTNGARSPNKIAAIIYFISICRVA